MKSKILALSKNEEFKNLLKQKKISNKYVSIFFGKLLNKDKKRLNISFVTKKKIGNAVKRNKIKRRLRNIVNEAVKLDSNYYHATIRSTELPISSFSSLDLPLPSSDYSILESPGRYLKFENLKSVESTSTVLISKSSSQTITSSHNSSSFEL